MKTNSQGLSYGEFRAVALQACPDPTLRVEWERAVRRAWQAGEDPTDYNAEIAQEMAKRRSTSLSQLGLLEEHT